MPTFLWLLLSFTLNVKSNIMQDYETISVNLLSPPVDKTSLALPLDVGKDKVSGCLCRGTMDREVVVCFGNYECKRFPKIKLEKCKVLVVRTTIISEISIGDLDSYTHVQVLKIDGNSRLEYLQPGLFKNLSNVEELSISYNTQLHSIHPDTFTGLVKLHNLTLANNAFKNIGLITPAFRPTILPSLRVLDISENAFGVIAEDAFIPMEGSKLSRLVINLCSLDYIHANSLTKLKELKQLRIGENDLSSSNIIGFLLALQADNINLTHLCISSMGFRKRPPMSLLKVIANSTISVLSLADNQFEVLEDDDFPTMPNIELLDLRRIFVMYIGAYSFSPVKFPKLRILLLSENNLPGIHVKHISNPQVLLLDLSSNKGRPTRPLYYEIDRGVFSDCRDLRFLNLAFNRLKHMYNHTFTGLINLRILNMENGTIFHIGNGTFKPLRRLELLNLGNNPLTANENLTSAMFDGLNELKVLILKNCGIKRFYDDDNIFEMMPNITHLILTSNQLSYITPEILKPLKTLRVLDLSQNLFVSWWQPLFLAAGVRPLKLYLMNNKITHFTISMIGDIDYLLENSNTTSVEIDLADNLFICDCNTMYRTYMWLQANGSIALQRYFQSSDVQCSSPDVWENRKVADYILSIKNRRCLIYNKITNMMLLIWTAPSLVSIALLIMILVVIYKYRIYIRYWIFLAKIALGRKFIRNSIKTKSDQKGYKYDAFVSYCNDDRQFVLDMTKELEAKPPFLKLCIYERDFEIGSFISESILGSINESRYIILIVSNAFAKSQWCRWETHLAEYHRLFLEDGSPYDPLVLIKIGEVDSKYLTTTLKYLLKTKIYHTWDEQNPEDFFIRLRNVLVKNK
ncbi:toll-like receptor 3 [Pieris napi]|uniref:toll-like receptor 3 n=1 Tax=Pieris napi TaxID=78633 RepID=UPI001FB8E546|nr:toll-like receptor 3 [Pieris napi]